jgi:ribosomal protein L37E
MSWWADKLNGRAPSHTVAPAPTPQGGTPQYPDQRLTPQGAVYGHLEASVQRQSQVPEAPRCPECGSGDYHASGQAKPRCFDCGYPLTQSGTGMGGKGSVRGSSPARQVETPPYKPNQIVATL